MIARNVVVLPTPFRPNSATASPRPTPNDKAWGVTQKYCTAGCGEGTKSNETKAALNEERRLLNHAQADSG